MEKQLEAEKFQQIAGADRQQTALPLAQLCGPRQETLFYEDDRIIPHVSLPTRNPGTGLHKVLRSSLTKVLNYANLVL